MYFASFYFILSSKVSALSVKLWIHWLYPSAEEQDCNLRKSILSMMLNCSRFWKSLVEVESANWGVVKLFNTQNKLMDVHQSDISKILPFSTSNLVSFIFIKSRHFTEAYLILLHKTSHASFSSSGFHVPVAERAHLLFLWSKIVHGITTTIWYCCLNFGECGVSLHFHYSHVHPDLDS